MQDQTKPLVSICCITYNHEAFIAQALEGFLMQETSFHYEILIGDDRSTDATGQIAASYAARYPDRIRLVPREQNLGAVRNHLLLIEEAKGRYIAMCDGDDFWTDPLKLQKQIMHLETHPEAVICCCYSRVIDDQGKLVYEHPEPRALQFSYQQVLMGEREETRMSSVVVRNVPEIRDLSTQQWYYQGFGSDTLFKLYATSRTGLKIHVLPEVMAAYRWHAGGVWSMIDSKLRKHRMVSDFNIMISHFSYSTGMKYRLLGFYIRRYFLFDLRYFKFRRALTTLSKLA
ncbi:family 2 glycosyl transferase [Pedobacter yulinensis]|uniref:Family 2 glycosyl transferase n=1 Tax=Pedobacter yulinensis TaxID=2126353 RepID=A0A2T3HLE7_9SPHI|nr:glycosyltransferase family 2 protein [Pedobacter yulinensis]PST83260.1 family 2 glycosyl transferase [Pedobacter yulinensis]